MKKILFVSSYNTGYGHKSITEALSEQLKRFQCDVKIDEIDAFMLGGTFTKSLSKLYNKVAVNAPNLWGFSYKFGDICPSMINFFASNNIKRNFQDLITELDPDLIITVHPGFVGSIINILKGHGKDIPVMVMVADLDNVTKLWSDKRSEYILCPTENSRKTMLKFGVSEDKIKVFGFPTRERFNGFIPSSGYLPSQAILSKERFTFLLMNGSEGVSHSIKVAKILLINFNCNVIVLAGRDADLKKSLEDELFPQYSDRVTICGFITNVEYYMNISDILILRASPNVLMEAVNLCKPIIITGAFTGQEEKNPEFVENNNLGIVCTDIDNLPSSINSLLAENGKKLDQIYRGQLSFRNPEAAKNITEFIMNYLENR